MSMSSVDLQGGSTLMNQATFFYVESIRMYLYFGNESSFSWMFSENGKEGFVTSGW